MNSKASCLYVPAEGDIRVIPFTPTTLREYLGQHYEGICIFKPNYRLSGFIRSFDTSAPLNKRCTDIYVAEIRGPVIIVNEGEEEDEGEEEGEYLLSLTEKDITKIFNLGVSR